MKELYNKVIEAYKSGDENLFTAAARNWIEGSDKADFKDPKARELFSKAKRNYSIWKSGAISSRVSKIRMVDCVREIAKKNLPNPYIPAEVPAETIEHVEVKHVLGVIPEKETNPLINVKEGFEEFEPKEELKKEPKEEKKIFRRKKR